MIPQQQRSEETRSHILEAAATSFAQQGYDAVGVAELCARAGVSKGAFYYHFLTKQAVFLELLNRWLAELDEQLAAALAGAGTVPEGLRRMARMTHTVFHAASGQMPLFLEFWSKATRDPQVWQATIAPYRRYQATFTDIIKTGIAQGSLRPVEPAKAARFLLSLTVGLILQGVLDPQGADWGLAMEESVEMFLGGLENVKRET